LVNSFYILPFFIDLRLRSLSYNYLKYVHLGKAISERSTNPPLHANIPRPTSDGLRINYFCQQSTSIVAHQPTDDFFLQPPRSANKTLFLGTKLGEILQTMSFTKSVPKGLKLSEYEWALGVKFHPFVTFPRRILYKREDYRRPRFP
jgi:hypothetical protein